MRIAITLAVLIALESSARAGADVGVIVTGEDSMQPQLAAQIADWLSRHGHTLVASPMPADVIPKLIDCFQLDNQTCVRDLVEKRANASSMVLARIDTRNNESNGTRDVTLTAYWIDKGHDGVGEHSTCQRCTDQRLRTAAEEIMKKLTGSSAPGHVKLTSFPAGARITIDGQAIGVTPLNWDLPPGKHTIQMDKPGLVPGSRDVVVVSDRTDVLSMELRPPPTADHQGTDHPHLVPGIVIGAGLLAGAAGWLISDNAAEPGPGEQRHRYIYSGPGIGLVVAGGVAAGVGAILWFRHSKAASTSAPTVALLPGGGVAGWTTSF